MADVSRVYRFDKALATKILEAAQKSNGSRGLSTDEMIEMSRFDDYSYEALVANCLYLWNDACIHLQSGEIRENSLGGNRNYFVLGLTGIGEDRLRRLKTSND